MTAKSANPLKIPAQDLKYISFESPEPGEGGAEVGRARILWAPGCARLARSDMSGGCGRSVATSLAMGRKRRKMK